MEPETSLGTTESEASKHGSSKKVIIVVVLAGVLFLILAVLLLGDLGIGSKRYPDIAEADRLRQQGELSKAFSNAWNAEKKYRADNKAKKKSIDLQTKIMRDRFKDTGNGIIEDQLTGLMWSKETYGPFSWRQAVSYLRDLKLGAFKDWRMPYHGDYLPVLFTYRYQGHNYLHWKTNACYWTFSTDEAQDITYCINFDTKTIPAKIIRNGGRDRYYIRAIRGPDNTWMNKELLWGLDEW